jgi:hypothetical protein
MAQPGKKGKIFQKIHLSKYNKQNNISGLAIQI